MNKKNKFEKPELNVEELSKALYEANLKLQRANEKLQAQEKERLVFYANISHDLRAPITAISNSLEYMLSNKNISASEQLDTLKIIQKRTDYMSHLINDIFLLSSLESSDEKVHKEPIDISFFLEDYFYMCEADKRFENVHLHLDLPSNLSVTMMADPILMHRVLDNLFSNALKYSSSSPEITLSARLTDSTLTISVSDNGIGIAQKHLPYIFDRSYMAQKSRTPNDNASSGFGLSIVKTIVEHHNGTITCDSDAGKGSCFTMHFKI